LSAAPSDSGSDGEAQRAPKKRKRGKDAPVVVKREVEEKSIAAIASPQKDAKVKKARRAPAKKTKTSDGSVKIEPPAFHNILSTRDTKSARTVSIPQYRSRYEEQFEESKLIAGTAQAYLDS
jgi:regulation of enolase protein 1 (concanavalin A-like superfamily)